jgi:flagellar biosynthesis chaperone FliJ
MENKGITDPKLINENAVVTNRLKHARKEGVTKGALTTGIISLVLLIALTVMTYSMYKREQNTHLALMENQKTTFTEQLTSRDSMLNDWLVTFDQIEKNLNLIKEKEKIITVTSSGSEISNNRRDQILGDIKYINTLIDENKKKIARLTAQLKESGGAIKGLQTRIASLEESMKQYENDIAEMKTNLVTKDFEIGQLNNQMVALNDTISRKDEKISVQTGKLNQAFLASGTFKDLKEKGLVTKEGGFLGLGRKEFLVGDFSDSTFTEIDITQTKSIPVNSKKAKLITEHPSNSYELIHENDNQIAYIEIKNPEEFWKITKYAVVEIVK